MKNLLTVILCTLIINVFSGCSPSLQEYKKDYVGFFDTYTTITIYAENSETFEKYSTIFKDSMVRLNNLFDIYNNYDGINNLKTINDNAGVKPVKVDKDIIELLKFAKEAYTDSSQKINCAFGSVLKIWHNYRTTALNSPEKAALPTTEELTNASKNTNISALQIDEKNSTVFISDKNVSLDVGALAKGFAVQKTVDLLKKENLQSALLNIGGNVYAIGAPPDRESWKVGIQNADNPESTDFYDKIPVKDKAVVTSGNYQRYYTFNGKKYHHIIDTNTLMPADTFKNVTVICDDSAIADMLSTALFILPYEDGKNLAKKYNADVLWVFSDNQIEKTY